MNCPSLVDISFQTANMMTQPATKFLSLLHSFQSGERVDGTCTPAHNKRTEELNEKGKDRCICGANIKKEFLHQ